MKRILILLNHYLPGYMAGGPIVSIRNMVEALQGEFEFYILTENHDVDRVTYDNILFDQWVDVDGCHIFYRSRRSIERVTLESVREFGISIVYVNSFFNWKFSISPLICMKLWRSRCKVVLAPRGELTAGALRMHSAKKKLYLVCFRLLFLGKDVTFHTTSEEEGTELKSALNGVSSTVVSNVQTKASVYSRFKRAGSLRMCYVARITPKKNLLFAVERVSEIGDLVIDFDVIGPVDDAAYWRLCKTKSECLPDNVNFRYLGMMPHADILKKYADYHLSMLPTLNENYGHAIVEALATGLPVLISDNTPWKNLEGHNAGYSLPLENGEKFVDAIRAVHAMDDGDFADMSVGAVTYAMSAVPSVRDLVGKYRLLFA